MLATTRMPSLGLTGPMPSAGDSWNTVARYTDYADAQRAVDHLSDDGFPVEHLDIVGSDLRLVERVTGRLTKARAAAAGALSGVWLGLLLGVLFSLFTTGLAWAVAVGIGVAAGALWGAALGFAAHAATRGRRDFASVHALVASRYDVVARHGSLDRARVMLGQAGLLPPPVEHVTGWGAR